jgi:hypothetical protein
LCPVILILFLCSFVQSHQAIVLFGLDSRIQRFSFFSFLLVFSPVLGLAGFDFVFLLPEPLVLDSAHAATLIFPQLVPAVHRSAKVSACRVLLHPQDFSLVARVLLALGCLPPRVLRFSPPPGLDVFCRSPGVRRVCLLRDFSLSLCRFGLLSFAALLSFARSRLKPSSVR